MRTFPPYYSQLNNYRDELHLQFWQCHIWLLVTEFFGRKSATLTTCVINKHWLVQRKWFLVYEMCIFVYVCVFGMVWSI